MAMCEEEATYKENTVATLRSYIRPWTAYLKANNVQPSTPVLAAYLNGKSYKGSTRQRVAKSLIHFCGVAMPGVPLVYKLPVQLKDKKEKAEVPKEVLKQLKLATIRELYGSNFAKKVETAAEKGQLLGVTTLHMAATYTHRAVPTEFPATVAAGKAELRTLAQKACIYFMCLTGCRPAESAYVVATGGAIGPVPLLSEKSKAQTPFHSK